VLVVSKSGRMVKYGRGMRADCVPPLIEMRVSRVYCSHARVRHVRCGRLLG
jgi:hypothetical protein